MRKTVTFFLGLLSIYSLYPQLNMQHNSIRIGDEIIKQQVQYKDPGRLGENIIWDFSQLRAINSEYSLYFESPTILDDTLYVMGKDTFLINEVLEDELIVGTEHNTMYYYHLQEDKLLLLGHENPLTLLHYTEPLVNAVYPLYYEENKESRYQMDVLYSGKEDFPSKGNVNISLDATGKMILPSGDTLLHVVRQKSVRKDVTPILVLAADSVTLLPDTLYTEIENYKWYSKGYRYPVFETVRSFTIQQEERLENFSTAFFYPPQEHYYLSADLENLAVLDSLWMEQNKNNYPDPGNTGDTNNGKLFSYNFYPNPVTTLLTIEYMLEGDANVRISLFDITGKQVKAIPAQTKLRGFYTEVMEVTGLTSGNYILRLHINEEIVNEKIIKR